MPIFEIEKDGQLFEVDAPDMQTAAAAFSDAPAQGPRMPARGDPRMAQAAMEGNAQIATAVKAGVPRAPRSFMEGAEAFVTDVAHGILGPNPTEKAAGMPDPIGQFRDERRGIIDARRAEAEAKAPGSVLVSDIAAGAVPIGGGAKLATQAKTLMGAATKAATGGAVAANLGYQAPEDRPTSTVIGAAFPGVVRAIKSAPGAFMNFLQRQVARRADPQTQALRTQAAQAFVNPETGQPLGGADDYTVAQAAGDPRLSRLAGQSADTRARDTVRDQLDQRVANIRTVANSLGGQSRILTNEDAAKAFYKVVDDHDFAARKARGDLYKTDMAKLTASPEGKAVRVPLAPVLTELEAIQREFGNPIALAKDTATGARVAEAIENLEKAKSMGAVYARITGLEELTKGINAGRVFGQAVLDPKEATLQVIRNRLNKALQSSVESIPGNDKGATELKRIQREYAVRSDEIRRIEDDTVTQLFGDKGVLADPEAAFDKLIKANPEAQALGARILAHRDPAVLAHIRKRFLDNVLDSATSGAKSGMQSTLNPQALYEGLTGDKIMKSPLFNSQEKKWIAGTAADLRIILNSFPDVTKPGTDLPPADLAINIVARSPEFLTRYLTRVATGLGLEDLMFTPQGRQAVNTVRTFRTASGAAKEQAAAYLIGLVAREGEPGEPN
jgi:hypothetical protein